jgi:hypothetical protein
VLLIQPRCWFNESTTEAGSAIRLPRRDRAYSRAASNHCFFDFNADSIAGDSPCPNTRRSNYVCLDALDAYRRARKKPAVAG